MLCEINFGHSRSTKSAILTHSEAVNLVLHEFLHFLKAEIYQINKSGSTRNSKSWVKQFLKDVTISNLGTYLFISKHCVCDGVVTMTFFELNIFYYFGGVLQNRV